MPLATDFVTQPELIRAFVYGFDKTKKTTWALEAAKAGYRVLLLDFNKGANVLRHFPKEILNKIYILSFADGPHDNFCSIASAAILRNLDFYFHEQKRLISPRRIAGAYHCNLCDFGTDTVIVFDGYTDIVKSSLKQFAKEQNLDLSEAEKQEWPGFGWQGRYLTWVISRIKTITNCHTITIGHSTVYEKHKKDSQGKQLPEIEFTRRQPVSSSNPHGMTITSEFNEVMYFSIQNSVNFIDVKSSDEQCGGSRVLKPGVYKYDDLSFGALAGLYGCPTPQNTQPFNFTKTQALKTNKPTLSSKTNDDKPVLLQSSVQKSTISLNTTR